MDKKKEDQLILFFYVIKFISIHRQVSMLYDNFLLLIRQCEQQSFVSVIYLCNEEYIIIEYSKNARYFPPNILRVIFLFLKILCVKSFNIKYIFSPYSEICLLLAYDYETAGMMLTCYINLNISSYKKGYNKAIFPWKINFAPKILL